MANATVDDLLQRHGTTFCAELGIKIEAGTPSPLFRWLTACLLFSHPIRHTEVMKAAKALSKEGWRTAKAMAASSWEERVRVLNDNGYSRYDESTSERLQGMADHVILHYRGGLREVAGRDVAEERRLLKEIKGIGDTACNIFFREAQATWDEAFPFVDELAGASAERLGLPTDGKALAALVPRDEFPRFVAALTRDQLENK